jgi:hypothetical protein
MPAIKNPDVRTVELVSGAGEEVAVPIGGEDRGLIGVALI